MNTKERNIGLDLLRVFACFFVILYHVPQNIEAPLVFNDIFSRALNSLMFYFGRTAVPTFFILSGYFLLPAKYDTHEFFKKRLYRVFFPTAFWFIVYSLIGQSWDNPNVTFWTKKTPHFWYMYALLGIYLIVPVISHWYKEVPYKEKLFYISLWGLSLIFVICKNPISFEYSHQGSLYTTPFHSLLYVAGYIGYFVLGGIIKENRNWLLLHAKQIVVVSLITYFVLILVCCHLLGVSESNSIAYLSLPTCLLSFSIFILFLIVDEYILKRNTVKNHSNNVCGGGCPKT